MDWWFTRRGLLGTASAAVLASLAGCNGTDTASDPTGTGGSTETIVTSTSTPTEAGMSISTGTASSTPTGTASSSETPISTETATPTATETATPTATETATPTATETATPTPTPGAQITVTGLDADPTNVRQGGTVELTVEFSIDGGSGAPHDVRLRDGSGTLRRSRVATDGDSASTAFTVRCDRPGSRSFAVGDRSAVVTVEPWPDQFLGVDGTEFVVDDEPFGLFGTNNAYVTHKSDRTVDEVFRDASAMGLNVVRTILGAAGTEIGYCREFACGQSDYSLQPAPGEYDEAAFRRLDYTIATAKRHGLRLLPALITPSPGGMAAVVEWVDGASTLEDFYTHPECRALFREYVETLLTRENSYTGVEYRNEPAIALWELANEPETEGAPFGTALQDWIDEMAAHVKSIDSNHPVSVGLIGWNDPGNEADYLACFDSDDVDAASTHMYYDAAGIDDWVERHATGVHEELDKPLYVGEFGWDATRTEPDYADQLAARNEGFTEWYDQFERHDVAGSLFWFLLGHLDDGALFPDHDGFGVYYPEDEETVEIVTAAADRRGGLR